jgi:glucose-6-phosphate isomerase
MDVGRRSDEPELQQRQLLFGVVAYAAGQLGDEPVRSQGHVHKVAAHSGWPAPEILEIWQGRAVIYMQERTEDNPGKCIAVEARQGERVVVPPGWAHGVVSADSQNPLVFGAWCDREYGFEYAQIRQRGGLAWFPKIVSGRIEWNRNPKYRARDLKLRPARAYPELGLSNARPLYAHIAKANSIQWVSRPALLANVWGEFEP